MQEAAVPFQPKGEEPEWKMIYRLFEGLTFGDIVTYTQMSEALDRDIAANRGPVYRAQTELEKDHKTIEAVVGVGYRIVQPTEHIRLSKHHEKKARRQVTRGIDRATSADRSHLDFRQQQQLDDHTARLARVELVIDAHEKRITRAEALLHQAESDTNIKDLRDELVEKGVLDSDS